MQRLNTWLEQLPLRLRQAIFFCTFIVVFGGVMTLLYWITGLQGG